VITLFCVPKAFRGHIEIIQMNAIQSWARLSPFCEIILFGDEEGIAEAACHFGARHIPKVSRNEYGTPLLDDVFFKAQEAASYGVMCYVNADIILTLDIVKAIRCVQEKKRAFLMVGRRWNIDLDQPLDFSESDWQDRLRAFVRTSGKPAPPEWIDYFVFRRGFFRGLLPFALGRAGFDNWLLWKARSLGAPVINASEVITAVHQNHDYSHHPQGKKGVWEGPEAERNRELMGGWRHCFTLSDASHKLISAGLELNLTKERVIRVLWRRVMVRWSLWALTKTFPLRRRLGLYQSRNSL
jgi:hypothetical protein